MACRANSQGQWNLRERETNHNIVSSTSTCSLMHSLLDGLLTQLSNYIRHNRGVSQVDCLPNDTFGPLYARIQASYETGVNRTGDAKSAPIPSRVLDSMTLLEGRIVCITGASRGIGRATAIECAKHGASGLILHYYGDKETTEEAEQLKTSIQREYTKCKVVIIAGDIALQETSKKVCIVILSEAEHPTIAFRS